MTELQHHLPGQTPLEPRDLEGLMPGHIQTQAELNEFEAANIRRATEKYLTGRRGKVDLYDPEGLKKIHKDMFDQTWKWAGQLRRRDINIGKGIHWSHLPQELKNACDDLKYWIENKTYDPVEIAVRFHHRLVSIHAFPNGNGRHARLVADIILRQYNLSPLPWGTQDLQQASLVRDAYIAALQKADQGDFADLIRLAQSA